MSCMGCPVAINRGHLDAKRYKGHLLTLEEMRLYKRCDMHCDLCRLRREALHLYNADLPSTGFSKFYSSYKKNH